MALMDVITHNSSNHVFCNTIDTECKEQFEVH